MSVLIGTLAIALFNGSKDLIARNFAYLYAAISVGILVRILRIFSLFAKVFFFPSPSSSWILSPIHLSIVISQGVCVCPVSTSYHHDPQT